MVGAKTPLPPAAGATGAGFEAMVRATDTAAATGAGAAGA